MFEMHAAGEGSASHEPAAGATEALSFAWQLPNIHPYPSTDEDALQLMLCVTRLPSIIEDYLRILDQASQQGLSRNEGAVRLREHQISRIFDSLRTLKTRHFREEGGVGFDESAMGMDPTSMGARAGGDVASEIKMLIEDAFLMWESILGTDAMENALRWKQPMTVTMEKLSIMSDRARLVLGPGDKYRRAMSQSNSVVCSSVRVFLIACIVISMAVTIAGGMETLPAQTVMAINLGSLVVALILAAMISNRYAHLTERLTTMHYDLVDLSYISDAYIFSKSGPHHHHHAGGGSVREQEVSILSPKGGPGLARTATKAHLERAEDSSNSMLNYSNSQGPKVSRSKKRDVGDSSYNDDGDWQASQVNLWGASTGSAMNASGSKANVILKKKKNIMAQAAMDGNNFIQFPLGQGQARVYSSMIHEQVFMIGFHAVTRNILLWNTAAQIYTGFAHSECVGRNLEDLVDVDEELEERIQNFGEGPFGQDQFEVNIHAVGTRFKMMAVLASVVTKSKSIGLVLFCTFPKQEDQKILNAFQSLRHQQLGKILTDEIYTPPMKLSKIAHFLPLLSAGALHRDAETFSTLGEYITLNQLLSSATTRCPQKVGQIDNWVVNPKPGPGGADPMMISFVPGSAGGPNAPVADKNTRFLMAPDTPGCLEAALLYGGPSKCDITLEIQQLKKVSVLEVTIRPTPLEDQQDDLGKTVSKQQTALNVEGNEALAENSGASQTNLIFNVKLLEEKLGDVVKRSGGTKEVSEEVVKLSIPCFMPKDLIGDDNQGMAEDDDHLKDEFANLPGFLTEDRSGRREESEPVPVLETGLNISLLLSNTIDLHNISYLMMPVGGVTLGAVATVDQINWTTGNLDVLFADSRMVPSLREVCEQHGVLLVSCLLPRATAHDAASEQYHLPRPFTTSDVYPLIKELSQVVFERRQRQVKELEDARLLALHRDQPWTRGKLLGSGAAGNVYEATNDLTGGQMAVKMFHFKPDTAATVISSMTEEIAIHCTLFHPNIVQYFHCEHRSEFEMNIFMEKCDESLDSYLRRKSNALSITEAASITRQLISALVYLRSMKIVHRDIKPPNILMKNGVCKLTDFGTAKKKEEGDEDFNDDVQGTLQYMAPEVYRGKKYDHTCDIWSVGCVLCMLLNTLPDFMKNYHMLAEITPESEILLPTALVKSMNPQIALAKDFIENCLRPDPSSRPSIDALALHPFVADQMPEAAAEIYVAARQSIAGMENSSRAPSIFSICSDDD